jgi:hypothetical protein
MTPRLSLLGIALAALGALVVFVFDSPWGVVFSSVGLGCCAVSTVQSLRQARRSRLALIARLEELRAMPFPMSDDDWERMTRRIHHDAPDEPDEPDE